LATVVLFSQTAPVRVQTEALHVHAAAPPVTVHVSCGPHVVVGTHAVQPLACVWHVSTPLAPHSVVPAVHAFVQQVALPAAPVHAPPVHCVGIADSKMQPCASFAQVTRVCALSHEAPVTPLQAAAALHEQTALPALPVQLWWVPHATGVPYA
jgi:hypothetical protein